MYALKNTLKSQEHSKRKFEHVYTTSCDTTSMFMSYC